MFTLNKGLCEKIPHTGDKNLSTDADSATDTILESSRDLSKNIYIYIYIYIYFEIA